MIGMRPLVPPRPIGLTHSSSVPLHACVIHLPGSTSHLDTVTVTCPKAFKIQLSPLSCVKIPSQFIGAHLHGTTSSMSEALKSITQLKEQVRVAMRSQLFTASEHILIPETLRSLAIALWGGQLQQDTTTRAKPRIVYC